MNLKKALGLVLAGSMLASALTACGAPASESTSTPASTSASESTSEENNANPYWVTDEPVEFSVFAGSPNKIFDENWSAFKKAAADTNVTLIGMLPSTTSDMDSAFNLMLSSGDLADIISYTDASVLETLGYDGGILPLNDLIAEHAPDVVAFMEENPAYARATTALDGNIYELKKAKFVYPAEYHWIRQDWLDKLGLEVPTTLDELEAVLTAFRNEDPNGNGQKDEIPLFDRAGWKMGDEYLSLWDTSTEFWPHDGKMVFEPMEEDFATGVKEFIRWYNEGLVDPELFTRGADGRDVLLGADQGGYTHDWGSAGDYNEKLGETIPGFNFTYMAPVANVNGNVVERVQRPLADTGWAISATCEDPITAIKYMNYFFTEEGIKTANWGVEGETYVVNADGTKSCTDAILDAGMSAVDANATYGIGYSVGYVQDVDHEYAMMSGVTKEVTELYNGNRDWFVKDLPIYRDGRLAMQYPEADADEYAKIMAKIRPYVDEMFQSWVLGAKDFDATYDEFLTKLDEYGIERALEINQSAYDVFLAGSNS